METPKRNHSEVDTASSPESPDHKRTMAESKSCTEDMTQSIQGIQKQLSELLESKPVWDSTQASVKTIEETLKGILDRVTKTEIDIKRITQHVHTVQDENKILKRKVHLLEEKSIKAEAYSRRDNLLFDGIPFTADENIEEKVKDIIRVHLKCDKDIKFVRVHRLPNKRKTTIAKFHYYKDRELVWNERRHLKGTKIWMDEDYPVEIRNRRQVLLPIYRAALKYKFDNDKRDMRVSLIQDVLTINNERYTVNNLQLLPSYLSLSQTSLVTKDDTVFFYNRSSPLSNFFPAKLNINGTDFCCSEQFYQLCKAEEARDDDAAQRIMMSSDPAEMYRVAQNIKADPNRWTEGRRLDVMRRALMAKFQQNDYLRAILVSTDGKTLVEASPVDDFWGASMGLKELMQSPNPSFTGRNELGKLLMEVRNDLK